MFSIVRNHLTLTYFCNFRGPGSPPYMFPNLSTATNSAPFVLLLRGSPVGNIIKYFTHPKCASPILIPISQPGFCSLSDSFDYRFKFVSISQIQVVFFFDSYSRYPAWFVSGGHSLSNRSTVDHSFVLANAVKLFLTRPVDGHIWHHRQDS